MHARIITASLALASPALAGVLGKTTSTVTEDVWVEGPSEVPTTSIKPVETVPTTKPAEPIGKCPPPKDIDRHWDEDRILNDTTKHHGHFKLFAYAKNFTGGPGEEDESHLAVHVKMHPGRKDIWDLVLGDDDKPEENIFQPKWNLKKNSLETDGSTPINDKLFLRLFPKELPGDSRDWITNPNEGKQSHRKDHKGPVVYGPVLTTNNNKRKYHKEDNAKLVAKDG